MKLTNSIRDAFISSVMNDVPSVDYREQIRDAVLKAFATALDPKVRAVWDDPKLRPYIETYACHAHGVSISVPSTNWGTAEMKNLPKAARESIDALAALMKVQDDTLSKLRTRVRQVAYGCTTRKALALALPEFEKYLPADEAAACRSLPVVANVVADFVKAGWPKDKAANEAKAKKSKAA